MNCRPFCGACCIAPSITSSIPGMPDGKPAGVPCIHLDAEFRCALFGDPSRPEVCAKFDAEEYVCGEDREQALHIISDMEDMTTPIIHTKELR